MTPPMRLASPKVLIIDDDATVVGALFAALKPIAQVLFSTDSAQAIGLAHSMAPDLVLLDVEMPGLDGVEICMRLRADARTADIPVIFITSHDSTAQQILCFEAGGVDFVQKPLDLAVVRARAGVQLALRQKTREAERAQAKLQEEKERLRVTLQSIGDAVITTDPAGLVTYLNPVAENMTGYREADALGLSIETVMPLRTGATSIPQTNPVRVALSEQRIVGMALDAQMRARDGRWTDVEDSAAPLWNAQGEIEGAVIVFHDVSAARAMAVKMTHLSHYDQLTNLPNRLLLMQRLDHALELAKRFGRQVGLLVINIDQFKLTNEVHGYGVGDTVLKCLTAHMEGVLKEGETLSRCSADEFLVLVPDASNAEALGNLARALLLAASKPINTEGAVHKPSVSIGISVYPDDATEQEMLLRHAEGARHRAKVDGRNCYRFFSQDMENALRQRYRMEQVIKKALESDAVVVLYQPKIDAATGLLHSVEALVRLRDDDHRLIAPAQFIALAEETRLIVPLGLAVFRKACQQSMRWRNARRPVKIGVNVSPVQFLVPDFWPSFLAVLKETGANPADIEIEITESLLIENQRPGVSKVSRYTRAWHHDCHGRLRNWLLKPFLPEVHATRLAEN
ncbi:MAG: diguanylate cyclase [Burkholderiaceae bacterium]|nr:diguanylate cyclase [Burkholderiaceae bacterium]